MSHSLGFVRLNLALSFFIIISMVQQKTPSAATCPCDLYATAGTPCVAAHSTVRLLLSTYTGPLYQVRRSSDNTTKDIYPISGGTAADGACASSFCAGTNVRHHHASTISPGRGTDLEYQGSGSPGSAARPPAHPANAKAESLYFSGHKVYSLFINAGNCYWRNGSTSGMPTGSQPEAMYMVTSGTHYNGQLLLRLREQ